MARLACSQRRAYESDRTVAKRAQARMARLACSQPAGLRERPDGRQASRGQDGEDFVQQSAARAGEFAEATELASHAGCRDGDGLGGHGMAGIARHVPSLDADKGPRRN
jgi:hypothetical protein